MPRIGPFENNTDAYAPHLSFIRPSFNPNFQRFVIFFPGEWSLWRLINVTVYTLRPLMPLEK
jgi:hypothetical protein